MILKYKHLIPFFFPTSVDFNFKRKADIKKNLNFFFFIDFLIKKKMPYILFFNFIYFNFFFNKIGLSDETVKFFFFRNNLLIKKNYNFSFFLVN